MLSDVLEFVFVLRLQARSVEQPVMAIASSVSAVDGSTASDDLCCWCTVVSQSRRPDAVNCSSHADIQSTDSTSAAAAAGCHGHSETTALISYKAFRSVCWVDFL